MAETFEAALAERVATMVDACTRCGKCVEVCPVTGPGGVNAEPREVISGILDVLRTGEGPEASRRWANACVLSGECIKACDYGVNPRFLLGMARLAMTRAKGQAAEQRRHGVEGFRKVAREVAHLSAAGAARTETGASTRRSARFRFLHRLQCTQDAAHCAPCPGYHGCARRHL
jgi:Fe-S oxidoreductase